MKQIVLSVFSCIVLFSCKENKPTVNVESSDSEKKSILTVSVELKTTKEDEFKVMLNQIDVDEFQKMNIQATEVIPVTNNYEKMRVSFFENTFSNKLVIGLGNKHPKSVDIKNISLSYGTRSINISKAQLSTYFSANTYSYFDDNMTIITKIEKDQHTPALYANTKLINLLTKE